MASTVKFIGLILGALLAGCAGGGGYVPDKNLMQIDTLGNLLLYYPEFRSIEFITDRTPSIDDEEIVFCCTAAFSNSRSPFYSAEKVAGPYVAQDGFNEGFKSARNNMAFTFTDGNWAFHSNSVETILRDCSARKGFGFSQTAIDVQNHAHDTTAADEPIIRIMRNEHGELMVRFTRHRYRALCEKDGRLCIAELKERGAYDDFVALLDSADIKTAIYLDCGLGWSYGWFRDNGGKLRRLHWLKGPYISNWLVFRR